DAGHYSKITQISINYITDKDKLAALLPVPMEPADVPVVNYNLQVCSGCDFLAGRGYNLISVNFSAVFKGKKDYVAGAYAAVLWENDTYPIILGREHFGAPKIYGEIPDPAYDDHTWRFSCSEYGNKLLDAEITNLNPVSDTDCKQMSQAGAEGNWICWRYLPGLGWKGAEVSYATVVKSKPVYHKAWTGDGKLQLFTVDFAQAPISYQIIKGLQGLPVKQYLPAVMSELSQDLLLTPTYRLS
ncbi:MAG: acetoacetate decarboxylase family protein, partial [Dehalococcoidales bacterium]|nr:acetoacetate decarboxylase family protein [Dehalococcoidales bacterium]